MPVSTTTCERDKIFGRFSVAAGQPADSTFLPARGGQGTSERGRQFGQCSFLDASSVPALNEFRYGFFGKR
jgi:hypothetical protein